MRNHVLVCLLIVAWILTVADLAGTCIGLALSPKIVARGETQMVVELTEQNQLVYTLPFPFFLLTVARITGIPLFIHWIANKEMPNWLMIICSFTLCFRITRLCYLVTTQLWYILL